MNDKKKKELHPAPNPSWISQKRNSSSPVLYMSGNIPITASVSILRTHFLLSLSKYKKQQMHCYCLHISTR